MVTMKIVVPFSSAALPASSPLMDTAIPPLSPPLCLSISVRVCVCVLLLLPLVARAVCVCAWSALVSKFKNTDECI